MMGSASETGGDRAVGTPDGDAAPAPAASGEANLERELTRARERLTFYDSFDALIQENIARSGDLLRQAAEQRETALREVADARAELDRRRAEQRATLTEIGEELVGLQERAGVLARRVIAALDDLAPLPHPAAPAGTTVSASSPSAAPPPTPSTNAPESVPTPPSPTPPPQPAGVTSGEAPATPIATDVSSPTAPDPAAPGAAAPESPRPMAIVVHGVPRAAAALSLQRHLHGLDHVDAVEAREYTAGVLRLQVLTHAPLGLDDLRAWDGGAELEPVNVLANVIEVKLPGAAGF